MLCGCILVVYNVVFDYVFFVVEVEIVEVEFLVDFVMCMVELVCWL